MNFNVPTYLTLGRIVMIPVLMLFFFMPWDYSNIVCSLIFLLAAITDWLDGYLARRWNEATPFGAFLDPVADKLMVAMVLVLLVQADPTPWLALPVSVIIGREITIASLREWMAEVGERSKVEVSWIGKVKTTAQMAAMVALLYRADLGFIPMRAVGYVLLYIAAILTLWSMVNYIRAALPSLLRDN